MRAARREYTKIDKLVVESEFHPRPGAVGMNRVGPSGSTRPRLGARRAGGSALPGRLEGAVGPQSQASAAGAGDAAGSVDVPRRPRATSTGRRVRARPGGAAVVEAIGSAVQGRGASR